jgi:predicted nucleic-acid-binding Zn-ribbon protein
MGAKCGDCGGNLYETTTASNGGYGPALLPGLGRFMHYARFRVVVCEACGLTRFYADSQARSRLAGSGRWRRI